MAIKKALVNYNGVTGELTDSDMLDRVMMDTTNLVDPYKYSSTYSISGGGSALSDSITLNGGGVLGSPKVYEITDSLTYNGNINLSNYSYIVIRGAIGQRPKIDTATPGGHGLYITGNITFNYGVIANLDIELSLDNRYGFYGWRQTGQTTIINDLYFKDITINGHTTDNTNDSTGGIVFKDDTGLNGFWVNGITVEDCFFNNVCSRTDSGAIMTFAVNNYVGNRNKFTWSGIPFGGVNKLTNTYWHRGCNAVEKNSIFYGGINETNDSYRHYVKLAQDFLFTFNQPTTVEFDNCIFASNPNVNRGAIVHNFNNTSTTTLNELYLTIKNCKFINCDGSAFIVRSDSVIHNGLISYHFENNTFENCKYAYLKDATMVSTLKYQNVFNNIYNNVSTITSNFSDLVLKDATGNTNFNIQKEPTGFVDNENVIVTYDSVARTVTLTGTVEAYYKGRQVNILTSGWVSSAHSATNGNYFLYYDGSSFQWITGAPSYDNLQICYVNYGATNKFAIREVHGFMNWQSHLELHNVIGTFRTSGGDLSDYTLSSTTPADRRPLVSACTIYDEDLKTVVNALSTESYTLHSLSGGSGTSNFTLASNDIVSLSTNQPFYNQWTGATWQQTLMGANQYQSIWLIAIPVTNDAGSQSYRFLWMQGQSQGTLASQQALQPQDLNFGDLRALSPEFIFIAKVIIQYTAANWVITSVNNLTGTRFIQTGSPAGLFLSSVSVDNTLQGNGTVSSPLGVFYTENLDVDIGTETVDTFSDILSNAATWFYSITDGTNSRAGTIQAVWNATTNVTVYNESFTGDIGTTSGVTFSVDINTDNVRLLCTVTTNNWTCKVRRILI